MCGCGCCRQSHRRLQKDGRLVNANNGRGATFNAVKPVNFPRLAVNHVATINNNNLSVSELRYRQGFQVHVITITHAERQDHCSVLERVFKKVVGENHCGNPLVTDVRRPPAARCRKGPEQELMEFVLLPDELLEARRWFPAVGGAHALISLGSWLNDLG